MKILIPASPVIDTFQRFLLVGALVLLVGCTEKKGPTQAESGSSAQEPPTQAELIRRGMVVYNQACLSCHSGNPNRAAVGPAIAGASLELLEARVVYQRYPEGYKPKGAGNIAAMPAFPHLKKDIPALHAYLQSVLP
jgi:mono/diheme cytochrome c family protein